MKNKLRKIHVENIDFFWSITNDKNTPKRDYVFLCIWIVGQKNAPWITVRYHFHNIWLFFGELISIKTPEEKEKAENFFHFKPLTPRKVAEIIRLSMELLNEKYADKLYNKNINLHLDDNGRLQWIEPN